jgi:hypothetical protein
MNFLGPLVEIGCYFVGSEFDTELTIVDVHIHLHLEAGVVVLQCVGFIWQSFSVPTLL